MRVVETLQTSLLSSRRTPSLPSPAMPRVPSPGSRAGRRWCTRGDLITLALAAMLCSATYCFSIWHNGRNAPEKIVLGKTPVVASPKLCDGGIGGGDDASAGLDFETHHSAEKAGLSVSTKAPAAISGRRALRGTARRPVYTASRSSSGGGKGLARVNDNKSRFTHAGAVRD